MAAELTVGHRSHTLPKEYSVGGVVLSEGFAMPATLQALQRGDGPEYEILVTTYPRSGTSRLVEIAWLLTNNIDVTGAKEIEQSARHLFLEFCDPSFEKCYGAEFTPPPGGFNVAKTHLPYHMMKEHANRDTKIIVGFRNPKDNLVSLYHFYRMNKRLGNFPGTFSEFFQLFKDKHLIYGDILEYNAGWWSIRDRPNTTYVNYEDLTEDPVKEDAGVEFDVHSSAHSTVGRGSGIKMPKAIKKLQEMGHDLFEWLKETVSLELPAADPLHCQATRNILITVRDRINI
ncbi:hypothetical protein CAPTEDRAFT_213021 [Capitella teleta]|uniref:Sulfotransferase domain-containing protein n=1 Tax=Capitella teleta TaxID=283909 RepID=R7UJ61_CAPTE|nr:hypothetical protein CAPTEDRAFT_213021 [Capitella teleta]|eukprot:ELU06574.1 hypothetical protein CAPTEDRAFT_213021 [Capitella teleta]